MTARRYLWDTNVPVALISAAHVHHASAKRWFEGLHGGAEVFFCRTTVLGFLRVLSQPYAPKTPPLPNREVLEHYRSLRANPLVGFLAEPPGFGDHGMEAVAGDLAEPKLWADAYPASLARAVSATFVTFDRACARYREQGTEVEILSPAR